MSEMTHSINALVGGVIPHQRLVKIRHYNTIQPNPIILTKNTIKLDIQTRIFVKDLSIRLVPVSNVINNQLNDFPQYDIKK